CVRACAKCMRSAQRRMTPMCSLGAAAQHCSHHWHLALRFIQCLPMSGDLPRVELYTDGACSGNPGPGGWAYILRHTASGTEKVASGGEPSTTNNRMELLSVINGLSALDRP